MVLQNALTTNALRLTIIIICFLLFVAKIYYDTNTIEIRHYQIQSYGKASPQHSSTFSSNSSTAALQHRSTLVEALNGLKVAHLSDLHMKSIGVKENEILEILKEEKPDLDRVCIVISLYGEQ